MQTKTAGAGGTRGVLATLMGLSWLVASPSVSWALSAFQESGGQVVIEAEHHDESISRNGKDWVLETSRNGYSGSGYVTALPDSGTNRNSGYVTRSPELIYNVLFNSPGTYYVWVRGFDASGSSDSVHAGLDGTGPASADRISRFENNVWSWSRETMDSSAPATIDVPTAGVHTLHLWMREDGLPVDKVLLRADSSSTEPSGSGPAESPRNDVAFVLPPDGMTLPAARYTARSDRWSMIGTEMRTPYENEWLEYLIDFGSAPPWLISLTAKNDDDLGLPAGGYTFQIDLTVDGVLQDTVMIPGSDTAYQTGTSSPLTVSGVRTLRLSWPNGIYKANEYDSNLLLRDLAFAPGTPEADTSAPTIQMTAPAEGSTVSGSMVTVAATASDDVGVAGVQFILDGANLGAEDTAAPYEIVWDTTAASNGTHTLTAVARDAASNTATATPVGVTVQNDTIPPTITGPNISGVTQTEASVAWTTDEPSTGSVDYGPTTAYGSSVSSGASLATSHSASLTGLNPGTFYHVRVTAADAGGLSSTSADATFTTAADVDATPPVCALTLNGGAQATSTVAVTLALSCTDASGTMAQMQFSDDGATWSPPEPYASTKPWTLPSGDGPKTVFAQASDDSGNWSTPVSAEILLDTTPPELIFLSPLDGEVITAP